jgi:L-alanine-DL-glutamate epimerase-like enolase superfamily enzyme
MGVKMSVEAKTFPLAAPFSITGYTFTELKCVWVTLDEDGVVGRGEGTGSYYLGEDQESLMRSIKSIRIAVESGITREELGTLLPIGGARNAVDCAMWDWECKKAGLSIWQLLDVEPQELTTVATIGVDTPELMAAKAVAWKDFPALKVKLDNELVLERMGAIRSARPDATLIIDVNQGWSIADLVAYTPGLMDFDVSFIEQPLPRGQDHDLVGYQSPIPLGGDESCLGLADYERVLDRYDVINIKLDKCGGLTEGLAIVERATTEGNGLMVGNMTGTSLSMAPSYVLGQFCRLVDIDGPLLLERDVQHGLEYRTGGVVAIPTSALWG